MSEERESAMIQAVGAVAEDRPAQPGQGHHLPGGVRRPAWKNTGAVMRAVSEMRLAGCASPRRWTSRSTPRLDHGVHAGRADAAGHQDQRDDYSYEQRLSVALLYMVSQFARKLLNGIDRRLPKAIFLDEASGDHVYSRGRQAGARGVTDGPVAEHRADPGLAECR